MSNFYVVATPIGNLSDITLRALETLKSCDIILCEDSRITMRLLHKYDIINKKLLIYNDNSCEKIRQKVAQLLASGQNIALVSDAGTPLISDPGYKLIEFLQAKNFKIIPIPGPSSLTSALCVSGIALDNFLFLGFLPAAEVARKKILQDLPKNYSFVVFESANRAEKFLHEVVEILGNRKIAIAREITKIHEEIVKDYARNLLEFFQNNEEKLRGEFVIIVEKQEKNAAKIDENQLKKEIAVMLKKGASVRDVSEDLAKIHDLNKKEVYKLVLEVIS